MEEQRAAGRTRGPAWVSAAAALWVVCALGLASLPHLPALLRATTPTPGKTRVVTVTVPGSKRAKRSHPPVARTASKPSHKPTHKKRRVHRKRKQKRFSPLEGAGNFSLPVRERYADPWELDDKHHDYPAWDLSLPRRTGVHAIVAGRVEKVTQHGACGKGVIIRDKLGFTYTYCHGSRVLVGKGRRVGEGRAILLSGNTGNSTGPHLHLQIQRASGRLVCPQPLLEAWAKGKPIPPRKDRETDCYRGAHPKRHKHQAKHDRKHHKKHEKKQAKHRKHGKGRRHNKNRHS